MPQGDEREPMLTAGEVLADRYRVLGEVGRGGMGVVYAAEHLQLPQRVAIKIMLHAFDAEARARFRQEAEVVVQLRSQHVGRVLDVGALDGGEPYIVMEWLDGMDLDRWLEERGPLPIADALGYVIQACEALAEAHLLGVVHRDLKPANLFLSRGLAGERLIKVLDFGIAKAPRGAGGPRTKTGALMGTPFFMAPEQLVDSRDVDARSDVWALGATLYQLLTGVLPFERATLSETQVAILRDPPPAMSLRRPELPPGVEAAVMRCLDKDPWGRFASVGDLVAALEPWAPAAVSPVAERVKRMMVAHGETALAPSPTFAQAPRLPAAPAPRARPLATVLWVCAALTLAAAITAVALMLAPGLTGPQEAPSAPPIISPATVGACGSRPHCLAGAFIVNWRVEPEKLFGPATELARTLAPEAELTMFYVHPLYDGRMPAVAAWEARPLVLYFAVHPGRPAQRVIVRVREDFMVAELLDETTETPAVDPPACPMSEALRLSYARPGCDRKGATTALFTQTRKRPAWEISCGDGIPYRYTADTCEPLP